MQIHKTNGDLCWVAECANPAEVKNAIEMMLDKALKIKEVHTYIPFKRSAGMTSEITEGHMFIVVGIAQTVI